MYSGQKKADTKVNIIEYYWSAPGVALFATMPIFYHATASSNQHSIERNGFFAGTSGHAGPGIYFCKRQEAATALALGQN